MARRHAETGVMGEPGELDASHASPFGRSPAGRDPGARRAPAMRDRWWRVRILGPSPGPGAQRAAESPAAARTWAGPPTPAPTTWQVRSLSAGAAPPSGSVLARPASDEVDPVDGCPTPPRDEQSDRAGDVADDALPTGPSDDDTAEDRLSLAGSHRAHQARREAGDVQTAAMAPDAPDSATPGDAEAARDAEASPGDEPASRAVGTEHGDRGRFLAAARDRLASGITPNLVHPAPPPPPPDVEEPVPEPSYANLDPDDLVGTFVRAVQEAGGVCHEVAGEVPDALLDHLVAELDAWDVVVSAEPDAVALGERLATRGVEVRPASPEAGARSVLGVTSAVAGIAATGSVVLDSRRAAGRVASLLPAVHLCVLSADRLVATPGEVLRRLGDDPSALPPTLVLETGPSRTGDIEQILTIGAHGPTRLHVLLVT